MGLVSCTVARSNVHWSATAAGWMAKYAEKNKSRGYADRRESFIFVHIPFETTSPICKGSQNKMSISSGSFKPFLNDIAKRIEARLVTTLVFLCFWCINDTDNVYLKSIFDIYYTLIDSRWVANELSAIGIVAYRIQ